MRSEPEGIRRRAPSPPKLVQRSRNAFKGSSEPVWADRIELAGQPPKPVAWPPENHHGNAKQERDCCAGVQALGAKRPTRGPGKMSSGTWLNRSC